MATEDLLAAAGLGTGGFLASRALSDSDFANNLLARYMTHRAPGPGKPDFRVPVYAGADLDLAHGSGEAVMASRMSRMLNNHGIGSVYSNTNGRPNNGEILDPKFQGSTWYSPNVKSNPYFWSDNTRIKGSDLSNLERMATTIDGKPSTALNELVDAMTHAGVSREAALNALRSGMFDKFTPGELYDTFKVVGRKGVADILAGRAPIMSYAELGDRHYWGRDLPYLMTGEAGMDYSSLAGNENAKAIGENTYPYPRSPRTRNLSLDTQFQANYRSPKDMLLPGSGMYDPGFGRRSRLGRMWRYYAPKLLGGGDRAAYREAINTLARRNGIDPRTISPKTKFMLISTGAAGANAAEKLRLAAKAFEGDPNVRILMQYGNANPKRHSAGLDIFTNNGIQEEIERINARRPGFVLAGPRMDGYDVLARNVDLHGTYGGSSTITEALGSTNPTVTMTDTLLNRGNNNYGTARRGIPQIDSAATALHREYERLRAQGLSPEAIRSRRINMRDGGTNTLGPTMDALGLNGADFDRIERESVQRLRDAMYHSPGKFDQRRVNAANEMLAERAARDRSFVKSIRRAVTGAIGDHDTARYRAMRPGFRKGLAGLSRLLFRTPAGRRIGIPLAIASALGVGGLLKSRS